MNIVSDNLEMKQYRTLHSAHVIHDNYYHTFRFYCYSLSRSIYYINKKKSINLL